tara:strand:- start:14592 stop:15356 length:765 start_codon:yes stop_codon:yes gene_type:complete
MKLLTFIVNTGSFEKSEFTLNELRKREYLNRKDFQIYFFCWNEFHRENISIYENYSNVKVIFKKYSLYKAINYLHNLSNSYFINVLHEGEEIYIDSSDIKDILVKNKSKLISFDYVLRSDSISPKEKYVYGNFCQNYYSMLCPHVTAFLPNKIYKNYSYDNKFKIIADYVLFSKLRRNIPDFNKQYLNIPFCSFTYGGNSTRLSSLLSIMKEHIRYDLKTKRFSKNIFNLIFLTKFAVMSFYNRIMMLNWENFE